MWSGCFVKYSERVNNKKCSTEPLDEERMARDGFSKEEITKIKHMYRCPFTSSQRTSEYPPSWLFAFGDFQRTENPKEKLSQQGEVSKEDVFKFKHMHRWQCPLKKSSQATDEQVNYVSETHTPKEEWARAIHNHYKMERTEDEKAQQHRHRCFWKNKSQTTGDQNVNMPNENAPWANAWGNYYKMKQMKEEKKAHHRCCCCKEDATNHRCFFKKNSQEKSDNPDSVVGVANGMAVWFFPKKQ